MHACTSHTATLEQINKYYYKCIPEYHRNRTSLVRIFLPGSLQQREEFHSTNYHGNISL